MRDALWRAPACFIERTHRFPLWLFRTRAQEARTRTLDAAQEILLRRCRGEEARENSTSLPRAHMHLRHTIRPIELQQW
ncbi:hypothetical protein MRX96_010376 [Rhipicephalus microplus]